jgi:hypothetical protein
MEVGDEILAPPMKKLLLRAQAGYKSIQNSGHHLVFEK